MAADSSAFIDALRWFIGGSLSAVLGYAMIFVTNTLSLQGWRKMSNVFFGVTCVFGAAALVLFCLASYDAVSGFKAAR